MQSLGSGMNGPARRQAAPFMQPAQRVGADTAADGKLHPKKDRL
jgi:hypothetical protein